MLVYYQIRYKTYSDEVFLQEEDPLTDEKGVAFEVTQRYMSCFGPFAPLSKKIVTAYSITTNQAIPLVLWTESMKQKAETELANAKGTWKLFMVPIIFCSLLAVLSLYRVIANKVNATNQASYQQIIANPAVGDIVYTKVMMSTVTGNTSKIAAQFATIGKISKIDKDTIFIRNSAQKVDMTNVFDMKKLINKFKIYDTEFEQQPVKYKKDVYTNQMALLPFTNNPNSEFSIPAIKHVER